jgi:aspartyl-tRNA(Asn)/glutamyl-tRNA(Gln) amidotransferase subunit C
MKLTREEVLHLARLVRLGLSEEEIEKFSVQLSNILDNFEILKQIDTTDLPPMAQSINLQNVFREDNATPSYDPEEILFNAPQREGGYFKIRAVLE